MKGCVRCHSTGTSAACQSVPVTSPPVAKPGKGNCRVRARFLVSDYSIDAGVAGKLMAAKFAPGHSSRLIAPAVLAGGEPPFLAVHYKAVSN